MYDLGVQDALSAISNGEGVDMRTHVDTYTAFKEGQFNSATLEQAQPDIHQLAMNGDISTIQ